MINVSVLTPDYSLATQGLALVGLLGCLPKGEFSIHVHSPTDGPLRKYLKDCDVTDGLEFNTVKADIVFGNTIFSAPHIAAISARDVATVLYLHEAHLAVDYMRDSGLGGCLDGIRFASVVLYPCYWLSGFYSQVRRGGKFREMVMPYLEVPGISSQSFILPEVPEGGFRVVLPLDPDRQSIVDKLTALLKGLAKEYTNASRGDRSSEPTTNASGPGLPTTLSETPAPKDPFAT
jgi:hypothetical protein